VAEGESVVDELARARLGKVLKGKWTLDRLLGVGGMAAVYGATHRNGARVAVKVLHPTLAASSRIRERFVREGYVANKVEHPGVVRVIDDDVADDGSPFLVMDLVVGRNLAQRGLDDLFDDAELIDVAEQLLEVLVAAHAKGIIHRDLKPENMLIDSHGKLHVLDFGIARLLEDANSATATKTGHGAGTPGFMAPEQVLGRAKEISGRTDLYAVGATLFALACGDFVHEAESPQELAVKVATVPARSLATCAPNVAREIVAFVDRATKTSPDDRFPDAATMLAEARRIRKSLGLERRVLRPEKVPVQRVLFSPSERASDPGSTTVAPPPPSTGTPGRLPPRPPPKRPQGNDIATPRASSLPPIATPPRRQAIERKPFAGRGVLVGVALLSVVGLGVVAAVLMRTSEPTKRSSITTPSHSMSAINEPSSAPPVSASETSSGAASETAPSSEPVPAPSDSATPPTPSSAAVPSALPVPPSLMPWPKLPVPSTSASASAPHAPSASAPPVPADSLGY